MSRSPVATGGVALVQDTPFVLYAATLLDGATATNKDPPPAIFHTSVAGSVRVFQLMASEDCLTTFDDQYPPESAEYVVATKPVDAPAIRTACEGALIADHVLPLFVVDSNSETSDPLLL
jgi:hypothetical protein